MPAHDFARTSEKKDTFPKRRVIQAGVDLQTLTSSQPSRESISKPIDGVKNGSRRQSPQKGSFRSKVDTLFYWVLQQH
jgi:hypothetical protein